MNGGMPKLFDLFSMKKSSIAFVMRKFVFGIVFVQPAHEFISRGLGEDGGACNAQRALVAFDDGSLGHVQFGEFETEIRQQILREVMKGFKCAARSQTGGGYDSQLIYFFGRGESDSVGEGACLNLRREFGALAGRQLLGVVDSAQRPKKMRMVVRENDRSNTDGPGEGAASGFVQSGNEFVGRPEFFFVGQVRAGNHTCRAGR